MACAVCNKSKTPPFTDGDYQVMWNTNNFSVVQYNGQNYPRLLGSPTGIITQYGIRDYGRHKNGDYVIVHNFDIEAKPELFIVITDDDIIAQTLLDYNIEPGYEPIPLTSNSYSLTMEVPQNRSLPDVLEVDDVELSSPELFDDEENDNEVEKNNSSEQKEEDNGLPRLTRSEAMQLNEFTETYGYNHRLTVMAEVNRNEPTLKAFKKGKKTYIYHDED
ncbi:MAG: hypothetical protein KC414_02690 [Romboutsia sp.]|nr:hypothetical protein [Romboutsia sp.]